MGLSLAVAPGTSVAVDGPGERCHDPVAALGGTLHPDPGLALLAQAIQHGREVGVLHLSTRPADHRIGNGPQFEGRQNIEDRGISVLAAIVDGRHDAGRTRRAQVLLGNGLGEARLNQIAEGLTAHLTAEALAQDLERDLAGAKPRNTRGARYLLEPVGHLGLELLRRQAHCHAPLQTLAAFH